MNAWFKATLLGLVSFGLLLPVQAGEMKEKASAMMTKPGTVVEVAIANGSFTTLVAAIKAAGLVNILSGKGPFTVFAPTDAAFAALPAGTVEDLLKPANKGKLVKILTYHVLSGNYPSSKITTGEVKTIEGKPVKISVASGTVMVNDAKVITADVPAKNGVIHVIDKVLLP